MTNTRHIFCSFLVSTFHRESRQISCSFHNEKSLHRKIFISFWSVNFRPKRCHISVAFNSKFPNEKLSHFLSAFVTSSAKNRHFFCYFLFIKFYIEKFHRKVVIFCNFHNKTLSQVTYFS